MALTLYGFGRSRAIRPLWALEELGLEFRYSVVDVAAGGLRDPAFLALNPTGKVPVLTDDDLVLTESAAIVAYLGDRYGDGTLVPRAGGRERGEYDRWSYFALAELEQPLWTMAKHKFALPRDWRVPEVRETAIREARMAQGWLSTALGDKEWLVGGRFTFADLLVAHTLEWARRFEVPAEQENLDSLRQRALARPAYARTQTHLPA